MGPESPGTAARQITRTAIVALRMLGGIGLLSGVVLAFWPAYEGLMSLASHDGAAAADEVAPGEPVQMVLFVESRPEGARLLVDDQDRGAVPAMLTLSCRVGETLDVRVTHPGYLAYRSELRCASRDTLDVRLRRSDPGGKGP